MKISLAALTVLSTTAVAVENQGDGGPGMMLGGDMTGYGGGDDDLSSLLDGALLATGMVMLDECDVDLEGLMDIADEAFGFTGTSADFDAILGFLDVFGETCGETPAAEFEDALGAFETCAGFDFMQVVETLPSAMLGAELMCLRSILSQVMPGEGEDEELNSSDLTLSEPCAQDLFGANPLGIMIRSLYLKPDHTLPCFKTLSQAVPLCTLQAWPMPVVGSWLKTFSCLVGATAPFLDDMCEAELEVLDHCLPAKVSKISCDTDTYAECVEQGSSMFALPAPLLGAPVSDACRRVAGIGDQSSVVDRYEATLAECVTVWPGWNENGDGGNPMKQEYIVEEVASQKQQAKHEDPAEVDETLIVVEDEVREDASSQHNGSTMFLTGLGSGFAVVGLAWAFFTRRTKRSVAGRRGFDSVEMVENSDLRLV